MATKPLGVSSRLPFCNTRHFPNRTVIRCWPSGLSVCSCSCRRLSRPPAPSSAPGPGTVLQAEGSAAQQGLSRPAALRWQKVLCLYQHIHSRNI